MDSQQQFCLKWNSFGSNLASTFSNLFKSETLTDVTLFCEGVTFKAHKLILAACSKHLADLFEDAAKSQYVMSVLFIILDGISAANMAALLEFMYKGEVHVSQDALSSFLKAAECLQVKGLSIEHEKLAVAQSQQSHEAAIEASQAAVARGKHGRLSSSGSKEECDTPHNMHHPVPSPSSYSSQAMSPYMQHAHHFNRNYEQRLNSSSTSGYESPRKRPLRSPSEMLHEAAAVRESVLRDGSKTANSRPGSPGLSGPGSTTTSGGPPQQQPLSLGYPPSSNSTSSLPQQPANEQTGASPEHKYEPNANTNTTAFDRTAAVESENTEHRHSMDDPGCPEDLRMKMDTNENQDEMINSSGNAGNNNSANGTVPPTIPTSGGYDCDQLEPPHPDVNPANLWNSVTSKLGHKSGGSVTTPDGKKLKCPFCERLYGYETNLRAHIRQRHQGIRVPCPFCSRTFTRNNTVRRHIAREHKTELSLKSFQQTQHAQQVHNHSQ